MVTLGWSSILSAKLKWSASPLLGHYFESTLGLDLAASLAARVRLL